jgi:membrane protease YdiL (CAAX protease family)
LKNKSIAIFIETIFIVGFLLFIYYVISSVIPKFVKIDQTTYSIIVLFVTIIIIFSCLWLVCDKSQKINFSYFFTKLRFKKITKKTFHNALGIFFISGILSGTIKFFLEKHQISFNGIQQFEFAKLHKQQEYPFFMFLTVLVTVIIIPLKEEIIFRGYLLQKQEIALGKYAWILNGFAFTLAHLIVYDFATLLLISPFSFLVAYKVQKHKDTSIGLLAHFFMNLPFVIKLLLV